VQCYHVCDFFFKYCLELPTRENYLERVAFRVFGITLYNRVQGRYFSLCLLDCETAVLPLPAVTAVVTRNVTALTITITNSHCCSYKKRHCAHNYHYQSSLLQLHEPSLRSLLPLPSVTDVAILTVTALTITITNRHCAPYYHYQASLL